MKIPYILILLLWLCTSCISKHGLSEIHNRSNYVQSDQFDAAPKVSVIFLGVSTLLIDDGKDQILIDGFLSRHSLFKTLCLQMSTDSVAVDKIISDYGINRLRYVVVSHSHYDHAFDAAYIAKKTGAILVGTESTKNIGRGCALPEAQMMLFEAGKDLSLGSYLFSFYAAKHSEPKWYNNDIGEKIEQPLAQPAKEKAYKEGGTFDFLISVHGRSMYIKSSPNCIEHNLDGIKADVLFLGLGEMKINAKANSFSENYYASTVGQLSPKLLVPIHWDYFFKPFSSELKGIPSTGKRFDYFSQKTQKDGIQFKILQGGEGISF